MKADEKRELNQQRLRPERGAKSPRESAWGWGPKRIDKCGQTASSKDTVGLLARPLRIDPTTVTSTMETNAQL